MYIVGLNHAKRFYFISKEEQRERLEENGFFILDHSYERITTAANAVKELNEKAARERGGKFCSAI
jgi:hypothetical protein